MPRTDEHRARSGLYPINLGTNIEAGVSEFGVAAPNYRRTEAGASSWRLPEPVFILRGLVPRAADAGRTQAELICLTDRDVQFTVDELKENPKIVLLLTTCDVPDIRIGRTA